MDIGIKRLYYVQFAFEAMCRGLLKRGLGKEEHLWPGG